MTGHLTFVKTYFEGAEKREILHEGKPSIVERTKKSSLNGRLQIIAYNGLKTRIARSAKPLKNNHNGVSET